MEGRRAVSSFNLLAIVWSTKAWTLQSKIVPNFLDTDPRFSSSLVFVGLQLHKDGVGASVKHAPIVTFR